MNRKGNVIRFIDYLDISDNAKRIAHELAEQIDMPVVFLIDHDFDKQMAIRHSLHHNEFWVLANHMPEHSEYERVILSNLYRGIQTRKRQLHLAPSPTYENELNSLKNSEVRTERMKYYYELLNAIHALVTTIDAEQYLKARGIFVSPSQREWLFKDRIAKLDEYLTMQRKYSGYIAYPEVELHQLTDYSRIASFDPNYLRALIARLRKIQPFIVAQRCIKRLTRLMEAIKDAEEKYSTQSSDSVPDWLTQEIVRILYLEDKVVFQRDYAFFGEHPIASNATADTYSFVPCDWENSAVLIRAMRHVNECISLLQSQNNGFYEGTIPEVHANIIRSEYINAYADKLGDSYYLSFSAGLLQTVIDSTDSFDINRIPQAIVNAFGEAEIRKRISKYCIYYIAAHEYAHVINKDCEPSASSSIPDEKEAKADQKACSMLKAALPFQHRPDPRQSPYEQYKHWQLEMTTIPIVLNIALAWCNKTFDRSTFHH